LQIDAASAAPHMPSGPYAQYSSAAQMLPAKPPHGVGALHGRAVQISVPIWQVQTLQPSPAGISPVPSGYLAPSTVTEQLPGGDVSQAPVCATFTPASVAEQAFRYCFPSHPHTGAALSVQALGMPVHSPL
jgi:hypothetical protein